MIKYLFNMKLFFIPIIFFVILCECISQTTITINGDLENPLIHNADEVVYADENLVIINKNEKFGGYLKGTEEILPVVFDRIDAFQHDENLVKYKSEWGVYENKIFKAVSNPVFKNPDLKAITESCSASLLEDRDRSLCVETSFRSEIERVYSSKMDELHGILLLNIVINDNGTIDNVSFDDKTSLKIGDDVKRMVFQKIDKWIPAKVESKSVKSSLPLSFNFNT